MATEPKVVKPPMNPNANKGDEDKKPKPGGASHEGPAKADDKPKTNPRRPAGRQPALQKKLEELFQGIATIVLVVNVEDAIIIEAAAPKLAKAYYDLSLENKYVKQMLERLVETSAWTSAVMITGMVLLPIAANHGLIPEGFPMPTAEMLSAD